MSKNDIFLYTICESCGAKFLKFVNDETLEIHLHQYAKYYDGDDVSHYYRDEVGDYTRLRPKCKKCPKKEKNRKIEVIK